MADIDLDADALRRDRQRYADLLLQVDREIATWSERAGHLQHAVEALDRLIALAGQKPGPGDTGPPSAATAPPPEPEPAPEQEDEAERAGGTLREVAASAEALAPTATPAAPEPVPPPAAPAADAPRGTDALRVILEGEPGRTWTLADLLAELDRRGWLPASRRPEEGVRISLKRLAERGGVVRTDDGRWRLAGAPEEPAPEGAWPPAAPPSAPDAPSAQAAPVAEQPRPAPPSAVPPPPPRPASFGRPVGGTVTEL